MKLYKKLLALSLIAMPFAVQAKDLPKLIENKTESFLNSKKNNDSDFQENQQVQIINGAQTFTATAMMQDDKGGIWASGAHIGVWKSDDFGKNWYKLDSNFFHNWVSAFIFQDKNTHRVFVSLGLDSQIGCILGQSDDYGKTWQPGTLANVFARQMLMDTNGALWVSAQNDMGLWYSNNDGNTWNPVNGISQDVITDCLMMTDDGTLIVSAGTDRFGDDWHTYRKEKNQTQFSKCDPNWANPEIFYITQGIGSDKTIWASIQGDYQLMKSVNEGKSWILVTAMNVPLDILEVCSNILEDVDNNLWVGSDEFGLYFSSDLGQSFTHNYYLTNGFSVNAIYQEHTADKRIYVSCRKYMYPDDTLFYVDNNLKMFKIKEMSDCSVFLFFEDTNLNLYFGTLNDKGIWVKNSLISLSSPENRNQTSVPDDNAFSTITNNELNLKINSMYVFQFLLNDTTIQTSETNLQINDKNKGLFSLQIHLRNENSYNYKIYILKSNNITFVDQAGKHLDIFDGYINKDFNQKVNVIYASGSTLYLSSYLKVKFFF